MCISMVKQIGFPVHLISVAYYYRLVLVEDITEMWQVSCHIWTNYIIKCYKMLIILHIVTGIMSFLRKWHNTIIPPTDTSCRQSSSSFYRDKIYIAVNLEVDYILYIMVVRLIDNLIYFWIVSLGLITRQWDCTVCALISQSKGRSSHISNFCKLCSLSRGFY